MFKVKLSLVPVNISDLFNLKNTQYNLRISNFELPRFETIKFGKKFNKIYGTSHLVEATKTLKNDWNSELG